MSDSLDDPFALLGLPRRFDISPGQLQAAYLKRAAELHPDRVPDPIRQAQAAQEAARINDAKTVLADDERRANVLLRLIGGPSKEQDKSLPDDFLQQMMEVRQEMAEALAGDNQLQRAQLEQWADQQREHYRTTVGKLFAKAGNGVRPLTPDTLHEIRLQLNAWRYIERMIEQLDPDYKSQI